MQEFQTVHISFKHTILELRGKGCKNNAEDTGDVQEDEGAACIFN